MGPNTSRSDYSLLPNPGQQNTPSRWLSPRRRTSYIAVLALFMVFVATFIYADGFDAMRRVSYDNADKAVVGDQNQVQGTSSSSLYHSVGLSHPKPTFHPRPPAVQQFHDDEDKPVSEEKKPEEKKPEEKPEEKKPEEKKPEENPEEEKPHDKKPEENPEEEKPHDKKPEEKKPEENKAEENKSEEKKPEEEKSHDKNPEEKKPEEKKPEEEKPEEKKPEPKKPDWTKPGGPRPEKIQRPEYFPVVLDKKPKFAYLLWLSNTPETDNENFSTDRYFHASRILLWQLLHDPATRASKDIDVIVMCGPKVSELHKERIRQDGAIVYSVTVPHTDNDGWLHPEQSRWGDIMGKLHAWELEQYTRILLLDGDIILQSPLDGIFHDPGAVTMRTKYDLVKYHDEPELPDNYLQCGFMELETRDHDWPPTDRGRTPGYFNAGFFMLQPNKKLYNYYTSLIGIPNRFDSTYMEQNLLNYAHRWDGPMPWREISGSWNAKLVADFDLEGGVASIHEKYWDLVGGGSRKLGTFAASKVYQAEGYWQAERDFLKAHPGLAKGQKGESGHS